MKNKDLTREELFKQIPALQDKIKSLEKTVAAQNQTEESLKTSEKNLSAILEKNADGIIIVDLDGTVLYVNPAAEKLFGKNKEFFLGYPFGFPVSTDESEKYFVIRIGDVFCDVELRVVNVNWQKRPAFQLSVRDITERKKAEKEIKKLNAELEKKVEERTNELMLVNKELEAFSYSVSHDLKAPLRAIDGFSKTLLDNAYMILDDESKRYFDIIRKNILKMSRLIDDLLSFSKASRQEIQYSKINMELTANEIFEEIRQVNAGREIEFIINSVPDIYGDAAMIKIVLKNLISNAVKFTGKKAKAMIEFGSKNEGAELEYYIKDNGVGFDMKYYEKLFGVFQRLHRQEDFEGTGIGLALVQRIIHRHKGRVWAEGKIDEGAVFYFTLPVK